MTDNRSDGEVVEMQRFHRCQICAASACRCDRCRGVEREERRDGEDASGELSAESRTEKSETQTGSAEEQE